MLVNLKVRTCIILVLLLFTGAMFLSNGVAWMGLNSSNTKLDQINSAYTDRAVPLNRAYTVFLRARLLLSTSLMDMQQGKTEQAAAQAKRSEGLMQDAFKMMDAFRKAPPLAGTEALGQALEAALKEYDTVLKGQAAALSNMAIQDYLNLNDSASNVNTKFREAVDNYLSFIDKRTDEFAAQAAVDHGVSRSVTIALLVIALVLAVGCWIFINRTVLKPLHEAGDHFEKISGGDFTGRIEVRSTNEIGQLFAAIKRMQESLTRTVATVRRGVDEINVGSREISAGNTDLSSRTEQQAASLEETAASMEELASTVKQNADNARQANQLAASASDVAERGGSAVAEVVNTMQGISASSRKISEIVSVIDGIAFQTNILALNAAVEAARAGEQGKGFAVVAGEVRSLAQRSAQAAKEIKGLIEDSVSKVGAGSQQVERAGATMQEIVASVKRVTDIMGEISAASEEQSSGIDQVNRAVSQMDEVTQQNAALVEEAAAAAGSLQEQAQRLAEAVAVFKINAGDVIEVPARQLAQQHSAPRVAAAQTEAQVSAARTAKPAAQAAAKPEPAAEPDHSPVTPPAAPAPRLAQPVRARPTANSGATAARPLRRPVVKTTDATDVKPVKPAPPAARRAPPADDDWESF
ncbi:methyl-accepting chemotaxis protein [Achromobacter xylosoxidans]|uniref:methyl-accepting chemotaxis protein n=8 Tax=Alcaligenes xylosoxydans xylosoxydans TaxID=85698 RepID=UPI0003323AB8|nr:methyl-accepting chemotaxis protein [Achromobacter xylosoxidans]MCH1985736.1 methyl-accepting chemotaxis protein [Achromobacter xylosoxidans]MCH4578833.1 methyl-accepting chemotaxis protein [Achromobacter xylosoxidans]QKI77987.1 HAMP domain-containing protein [Achromobacter xylosoxidans]CCH08222.1 Methyl-accepting chemotaxis protein I (serine chemoreceptor protein [Achromobacter xylosoxidans NH44784-1996]CUJ77518.1 Aspartate chemoreceptor protein [Achromobacter xylosoxidans]